MRNALTRTRLVLAAAAVVLAVAGARAAYSPAEAPPGDPRLVELLSGIDHVPSRATLDALAGGSAREMLIAIARGEREESADPGVRIRAYRALALYPDPSTEEALREGIAEHAGAAAVDTLYLRAAVDSLVDMAGPSAVEDLVPLLDHRSRDVRASAASALGDTGSNEAVSPLRARLSVEQIGQVRLAIAEALRELE